MTAQAPSKEKTMREALQGLVDLYARIWDRVDGALVLMPDSITMFEAAHSAAVDALECSAHEPVDVIEQRLTALRNEIASDLHSRAAAVIRAYASDAGEDHTVGICTCSDMRLADELDAAGASQPPGADAVSARLTECELALHHYAPHSEYFLRWELGGREVQHHEWEGP